MIFVRSEDLKYGMRLAKPIYNKTGVLLYERNTRLTMQGIESVKNFGLLGLYILEPAEPRRDQAGNPCSAGQHFPTGFGHHQR